MIYKYFVLPFSIDEILSFSNLINYFSVLNISVIPMFSREIEIDIWWNHTYSPLFHTSMKNAMRKYGITTCATIPEEVVISEQMMFFFNNDFRDYIKFKILGQNLHCSADICNNNSPETHFVVILCCVNSINVLRNVRQLNYLSVQLSTPNRWKRVSGQPTHCRLNWISIPDH